MKSITNLLSTPQNQRDPTEMLKEFEKSVETEDFHSLMDKIGLILSHTDAVVSVPNPRVDSPEGGDVSHESTDAVQNHSAGYRKRDVLLAFGEHLMTLAEMEPTEEIPRYMSLSLEIMPFLLLKESLSPKEIIAFAAAILMNLVVSSHLSKASTVGQHDPAKTNCKEGDPVLLLTDTMRKCGSPS